MPIFEGQELKQNRQYSPVEARDQRKGTKELIRVLPGLSHKRILAGPEDMVLCVIRGSSV